MKKRIILTTRQLLTWGISHFTPLSTRRGVGGEAFPPSPFGEGWGGAFTSHTPDSAPT